MNFCCCLAKWKMQQRTKGGFMEEGIEENWKGMGGLARSEDGKDENECASKYTPFGDLAQSH